MIDWTREFPAAITITDADGKVLDMNDKAIGTFEKYGGAELIGTSLYDCHPPHACEMIKKMLAGGEVNAYTIEKNGVHKLIYQSPWYQEGIIAGLVEISMQIPAEIKHYKRG